LIVNSLFGLGLGNGVLQNSSSQKYNDDLIETETGQFFTLIESAGHSSTPYIAG
jgi:hypothetical protein